MRPSNTSSIEALEKLYSYLESENELFTLGDLHEKLVSAGTDDVFVPKYLKQKLLDRYEDQVFFAEINGRKTVVRFRGVENHIINDKWCKNCKSNVDDVAEHIAKTAAKIIKNNFKNFLQTDDSTIYYP